MIKDHQKRLLSLLKEIDAICRRNDITYYCSGGTVIGAVRHGGFIPWDDDIDVCMMRSEFERFCEAFRKEQPRERFLLYNENDPDYHATIPRYAEAGSTSFCRYHLLGHVPAGVSIDIFILDPVSDDPEVQKSHLGKFFNYADIIMPFYCFSHRVADDHLDDYFICRREYEERGREVTGRLHDELFTMDAADSSHVCLRWASNPSIFPEELFGEPAYLPFEDMRIPVPCDWYRYLVLEYGMDWAQVPYSDVQSSHVTFNSLDSSYHECYVIRDEMYEDDELETLFEDRKKAVIRYEKKRRPLLRARAEIESKAALTAVGNRLKTTGDTLESMYDKSETASILDIFGPLLELQLSPWFIGRRATRHYYLYMYPVIIDMPERWLDVLLKTLLKAGRFADISRLLTAYERAGIKTPPVSYAEEALTFVQDAERLYYSSRFTECFDLAASCGIPEISDYIEDLRLASLAATDPAEALKHEEDLRTGSTLRRKALGDAYYLSGHEDSAKIIYKDVLDTTRNGMLWKDILEKTHQLPANAGSTVPYSPGKADLIEKKLLEEVAAICDSNEIPYVLDQPLAERIIACGNTGYVSDKKVMLMTKENARRFADAFDSSALSDRALFSWKNCSSIRDFILEYAFTDSIDIDIRDTEGSGSGRISVMIRILRSGDPFSPQGMIERGREYMAARDASGSKKRRLFDSLMHKAGSQCSGPYYYYINRPDRRPLRKSVAAHLLNDTVRITCDSTEYSVPRSIAETSDSKTGRDCNLKKPLPENRFLISGISRSGFEAIARASGLGRIDMADLRRSEAEANAFVRKVDKVWASLFERIFEAYSETSNG